MQTIMGEWDEEGNFNVVGAEPIRIGAPVASRTAAPAGGRPLPIRLGLKAPGAAIQLPPQPGWRHELAPGVPGPGYAREQLPLVPASGNGIFTSGGSTDIIFSARPQRPFRGTRIMAIVTRTPGSTAIPVITPGIFVGTSLVGAQLGDTALEAFGPTAIDSNIILFQATPGVDVQLPIHLRGSLASGEVIGCSIFIIGESARG